MRWLKGIVYCILGVLMVIPGVANAFSIILLIHLDSSAEDRILHVITGWLAVPLIVTIPIAVFGLILIMRGVIPKDRMRTLKEIESAESS